VKRSERWRQLMVVLAGTTLMCGAATASLGVGVHVAAADPPAAYNIVDLGAVPASVPGSILISPSSGLVLDLGLNKLYNIGTGTVTPVQPPPNGFEPIQMNNSGEVVGNNIELDPNDPAGVWNPVGGTVTQVSVSTAAHTFPDGACPEGDPPSDNCPFSISPAEGFFASGIDNAGDVVGQFGGVTFDTQIDADLPGADIYAGFAPGGQDADFTGLVPSGLTFPYNIFPNPDACQFNENQEQPDMGGSFTPGTPYA
jgi:hypothetical protein